VPTVIKIRRGPKSQIDQYIPKIGEFVYDKTNGKLLFGDNFTPGGYHVIFGNQFVVENNTYYGSSTYGVRGFHIFPSGVDITAKALNSNSSNNGYADQYFEIIDGEESTTSFGFKYDLLWDKTKDVNFKISYFLEDSGSEGTYVEITTKVYLLYKGDLSSSVTSGDGVLEDGVDTITAYDNENIGKIDIITLMNGRIPWQATYNESNPPEYVIVKFIRSDSDTYAGSLKILNIFAYQIANGNEYGYYLGGVNGSDYETGLKNTIQQFVFPMNSGEIRVLSQTLSESKFRMSAFNSSTHGYSVGGQIDESSDSLSTIESFKFAFNSGQANVSATLMDKRASSYGLNCSSYGFTIGGLDKGSLGVGSFYSSIERINLSFSSITSKKGNLLAYEDNPYSCYRAHIMAFNSSEYGFCLGGFGFNVSGEDLYMTPFSYIERFSFPFDVGNCLEGGRLTMSYDVNPQIEPELDPNNTKGTHGAGACNSSTYGYLFGGHAVGVAGGYSEDRGETVSKFDFSQPNGNSTVISDVKISDIARSQVSGCNSTIYGYAIGGHYNLQVFFQKIDRVLFPFDGSGTVDSVRICGNLSGTNHNSGVSCDGTDFVTMFL